MVSICYLAWATTIIRWLLLKIDDQSKLYSKSLKNNNSACDLPRSDRHISLTYSSYIIS